MDASPLEIKKSYRKLASKYHPDTYKGTNDSAHLFLEIQEAYSLLSDPTQRSTYNIKLLALLPNMQQPRGQSAKWSNQETIAHYLRQYPNDQLSEINRNELNIKLHALIGFQLANELFIESTYDNANKFVSNFLKLIQKLNDKQGLLILQELLQIAPEETKNDEVFQDFLAKLKRRLLWSSLKSWIIFLIAAIICLLLYTIGK